MSAIILFEEKQVRRAWNKDEEKWYFAIADVIAVLTGSVVPGAYWRKLKERLKKEGNQTVTDCHGLKMTAADGRQRLTDVANTEQLLRLIQSIPSPKAEPFKLWLARVGYERLEEIENPELALTVHPFRDFNGRTIRVFLLELLRRLDLPRVELAPQTGTGRAAYFAALEAADRRDFQPLVDLWRDRLAHAETPDA
jgi:BRO family, N-terminal domain